VTVVLGIVVGILFDRHGTSSSTCLFWGFAAACLSWGLLQILGRVREAAVAVVVIAGFFGAIYHHGAWNSLPVADVSQLLAQNPVLIRCKGVVVSEPVTTLPRENSFGSGLPPQSSTQFQLDVTTLSTRTGQQEVSGRLEIIVDGVLQHVRAGDRVDVQGWSQANRPLMNPGGFDSASFNRGNGVRGLVRVQQPDLINVIQTSQSIVERVRRTLRCRAEAVLESALSDDVRPIADAMLLGDRSMLHRDVRTEFVESGTVHLLAISGLHIGILMTFLLAIGRFLQLSSRHSILLAVAMLFIYLQVADCRPPMVRAFVIILIWSIGRLFRRPAFSANSLAVAAIVILGMNPANLFDVGSQLSFLAVAVIFWLTSLGRLSNGEPDVAAAPDVHPESPDVAKSVPDVLIHPWIRSLRTFGKYAGAMWLVSGSIWLISAPLVISVFNVISPAGLVINVFLIPLVAVGLWFGFAAVLIGMISQTLAWPFAFVFGLFLKGLLAAVDLAASIEMGHAYVPEPPGWWLLVFYAIVAFAMLATTLRNRPARLWSCVGVWVIFGLTLLPADRKDGSLRCTVLSVGHGLSVVVESPDGRTLVYDVGSRGGGTFSSRVLKEALWARGIEKVDALIVSHADVDHYNGVLDLLDSVPVGTILCSRHFPDARQPLTLRMFERAQELGVASSIISRGDTIKFDDSMAIRILQPVAASTYQSDNASSVVVEVEYRNRRILLTGDLDEDGLDELLSQPPRDVDVLLAPHHGAPAASPYELASWANPEWVIASAPTPAYQESLKSRYGSDTRVIMTSETGAVSIEITHDGALNVELFASDDGQINPQR
jgi:competence protein ComEC